MKTLLLALCLMLTLLVGVVSAEQTEFEPGQYHKAWYRDIPYNQVGDFEYIVLNDGTAEIVGYSGNDANLSIPAELNGVLVTSIGYEAFYNCPSLVSVTIPEDVTYIGIGAFRYCNHLTSIVIPHGVTVINFTTFCGCSSLTSITIPDSVTSIEKYAFDNCRSLTSIVLPDSVTSIDEYAFAYCDSLTSVILHEFVTKIAEDRNDTPPNETAFANCPNLTLTVCPGTIAEQYAKDSGIPYVYLEPWTCEPCQNYTDRYFCTECGAEKPAP